jgi:hypothetical protein
LVIVAPFAIVWFALIFASMLGDAPRIIPSLLGLTYFGYASIRWLSHRNDRTET